MTDRRARRLLDLLRIALDVVPSRRDEWLAALQGSDRAFADELRVLLAEPPADARGANVIDGVAERISHDGTAADLSGTRLGDFRLARKLGQGGAAVVYVAEDTRLGRPVALKLMRRAWALRSGDASFRHEARALAKLRHEHVAVVYDYGVHEWRDPLGAEHTIPWLAVELVDGARTIDSVARSKSIRARLELLIEACRGLAAAHQALIEHGDVSSMNVLVDRNDRVKVVDFGLARLGAADDTGKASPVAGNLPYLAPELLGDSPNLTIASAARDVFSFGVVMAEVLTGRSASELRDLAAAHGSSPAAVVPSLRTFDRELAQELDWIVAKATEADPSRRYANAALLLADLERFRDGRPISLAENRVGYVARKFVRRHPWHIATLGFALLALVAVSRLYLDDVRAAERKAADDRHAETLVALATSLAGAIEGHSDGGEPLPLDPVARKNLREATRHLSSLAAADVGWRVERLAAIGNLFRARGDFEDAEPPLRLAEALVAETSARESVEWSERQHDLGVLSHAREHFDDARSRLTEALERYERIKGPDHARTRHMRDDLAELLLASPVGHVDAEALLLENFFRTPPDDSAARARAAQRVAVGYLESNRPGLAIPWVDIGTADELSVEVGDDRRAAARETRAKLAKALHLPDQAALEIEQCIRIRRTMGHRARLATARAQSTLAQLHDEAGRRHAARDALTEAMQLCSDAVDDEHPEMLVLQAQVARAEARADQLETALCHANQLLETIDRKYGSTSLRAERTRNEVATWMLAAGATADALRRALEALQIHATASRATDPQLGTELCLLAEARLLSGAERDAIRWAHTGWAVGLALHPHCESIGLDSAISLARAASASKQRGLALGVCQALERREWIADDVYERAVSNAEALRLSALRPELR